MAAAQKRLLMAENSKLGRIDIVAMLRKDAAWTSLPLATREQLYALLPPQDEAEQSRDPDINPLMVPRLKPYIEEELRYWQDNLTEGRETKKWRGEAMQAGKDHVDGKFDDYKITAREEYWGKPGGEEATVNEEGAKVNGENGEESKEDVLVDGEGSKKAQLVNGGSKAKRTSTEKTEVEDSDAESSEL